MGLGYPSFYNKKLIIFNCVSSLSADVCSTGNKRDYQNSTLFINNDDILLISNLDARHCCKLENRSHEVISVVPFKGF